MKADHELTARELIEEIVRIQEEDNPYPEGTREEWEALDRRETLISLLHRKLTQEEQG